MDVDNVTKAVEALKSWASSQVLGQHALVESLLISLLADGHILVEGAPGLAKTRAVRALADGLEADFHRIQFTPDLLPADIIGTEIYRPEDGSFKFQSGPIFHNLILADEINRAPAKVQSALLEAMAERQVTVGAKTHHLPELFMVMATQNPIEQEGTHPLPEAQLDRFLMYVQLGYPDAETEQQILRLARNEAVAGLATPPTKLGQQELFTARQQALNIYMAQPLEDYLLQLVMATRQPEQWHADIARWIQHGVSPRATISLDRCVRARAWLAGRDHVTPDDIQVLAGDVLAHRLIVSYEAEAEGITGRDVVQALLEHVPVP